MAQVSGGIDIVIARLKKIVLIGLYLVGLLAIDLAFFGVRKIWITVVGLYLAGIGFFAIIHRKGFESAWPGRPIAKDPTLIAVIGSIWVMGGVMLASMYWWHL